MTLLTFADPLGLGRDGPRAGDADRARDDHAGAGAGADGRHQRRSPRLAAVRCRGQGADDGTWRILIAAILVFAMVTALCAAIFAWVGKGPSPQPGGRGPGDPASAPSPGR